jgi:nitrile hydratase
VSAHAAGTRVRVLAHEVVGHCRTPVYLKGCEGVVVSLAGTYRDPERLAYLEPGLPPRRLYRVRFRQADVWAGYAGPELDSLEADVYEHWLEPIGGAAKEA